MTRISSSLSAQNGSICCARCGHPLSLTGTSWKKRAALSTVSLSQIPGASPGLSTAVVVRQFACPKCLALLDSETALPDDPFLEDVVFG